MTATSAADPTKTATAIITLYPPLVITMTPSASVVYPGKTQQFTAQVTSAPDTNVTYSINPTTSGSISSTGLYTAPATVPAPPTVTVTATSVADPTKQTTSTITLSPPIIVTVTPASASLGIGVTQQFSASLTNTTNQAVVWSINPATGAGSISGTGLYTPPATIPAPTSVTVTATSVTDTSYTGTAAISLSAVSISAISPATATLFQGQSQQFTSTVTGAANTSITWSVIPATGAGVISTSGLYTAPAAITTTAATIQAASTADPTKVATATVTLVTGYSYRRTIAVNRTKVANTDQLNFPVMVNLTDPALKTVANGGKVSSSSGFDVTFASDSQCQNKLNFEVETWNGATGQLLTWVQVPTVSTSIDTVFFLCYGNTAITTSQSNRAATWDADHTGVWHMSNGVTLSAADSTGNANNGTVTGATATAGMVDGAAALNGTVNNYLLLPNTAFPNASSSTTLTFEAWIKTASPGGVLGFWDGSASVSAQPANYVPAMYIDSSGTLRGSFWYHSNVNFTVNSPRPITDNSWHQVVDTYNNGTESLYIDGVLAATRTGIAQQTIQGPFNFALGAAYTAFWPGGTGAWSYFNGSIDEVRFSKVVRSADWVATNYCNINPTCGFTSISPENPPLVIVVNPLTSSLGSGQTQQFSATLSVPNQNVIWNIIPATAGTINASTGLYTAPATISVPSTVTVTATSVFDASLSASATISLNPTAVSAVTPASATLSAGETQQFASSLTGTNTWTLTGPGTLSPTGLYSAPLCVTVQQTVTIRATSGAQTATATVTLLVSGGFAYRRPISINHAKVPNTDQTNFPVMVSLTDAALRTAANGGKIATPNGYDLIFTSDGQCKNKLNHEVETWNGATGQLLAWVQLPAVSTTVDTTFFLCYGNPSLTTDQSNKAATWDANHTGVWHMSSATAALGTDSTVNANNGLAGGAATTAGQIGAAGSYNGTAASYLLLPQAAFPNASFQTITLETWFKTASPGGILGAWSGLNVPPTGPFATSDWVPVLFVDNSGYLRTTLWNHGDFNAPGTTISSKPVTDNYWHQVAVTFSNGTETLYLDGAPAASRTGQAQRPFSTPFTFALGAAFTYYWGNTNNGWMFLNGALDEARFSKVARSADWIAASYNNVNSPSTFYTLSAENSNIVIRPNTAAVYATQALQYSAVPASCAASGVTWSMTPATGAGTLVPATGLYTAPAVISTTLVNTITATSTADPTVSSSVTLNLFPPVTVAVSPANASLGMGQSLPFTATLGNALDPSVTWSVLPAIGAIDKFGIYTAPATLSGQTQIRITATSVLDPTKSATVTLLVGPLAATPVITPPAGAYGGPQVVTLTTQTTAATIRYTIDGSIPTATTGLLYTVPFAVSTNTTVNAVAFGAGITNSTVATAAYTFIASTATVRYLFNDTSTQGSWPTIYGKDGYQVYGGTAALPAYATFGPIFDGDFYREFNFASDAIALDPRALFTSAAATNRTVTIINRNITDLNFDLNVGPTPRQVAMYLIDYDSNSRSHQVTMYDWTTNAVLDTRTVSSFNGGVYLVWTVSGRVKIVFHHLGGANIGLSGVFFDPLGVAVTPGSAALAAGQTQQFTAVVGSANPAVNWTTTLGTISASGLYTAPLTITTQQTATVTATSVADPTKTAKATVSLTPSATGGQMLAAVDLIAAALCRTRHPVPTVDAGVNQLIAINGPSLTFNLNGSALAYVLNDGEALSYQWTLISGPTPANFAARNAAVTTATITAAGIYTFQLAVNDGVATGYATTRVEVQTASFAWLTPSVSGPNPVGSTVLMTAYAAGTLGYPVFRLVVTGANPQVRDLTADSGPRK